MTFGNYAKRQLWAEPKNGLTDIVGTYQPSMSGILKHIRLRYVITENWTQDFSISIKLVDFYDTSRVIDSSNSLTLDDFTLPNAPFEFHQGWIRFDFPGNECIAKGNKYKLLIDFNAVTFNTDQSNFLAFAIDYPFRTYPTDGDADPTINGYADAQIYLERLYDDFVIR